MQVVFTKSAQKQLLKAPSHCQVKAMDWIEQVEVYGLEVVRKIPGYNDEALKGQKKHRRSIRLNKQWRMEYEETEKAVLITIVDVHPHKY